MLISERVKNISPSVTLAITAKAKKMKKEGIDVISFGAGEPDFDTPENIKEEGIKAIQNGVTRYTPAGGTQELKEEICIKFKNDNNLDYSPENIVVSCGAKHSIYNVFQCILNPGDEVIIPVPYWVSYPEMVKVADGIPVYVQTEEKENFILTPEKLSANLTSKTKAVIINSPSNPTGMIYSYDDLAAIADIAVKNNLIIISDEIYEKLIYDNTPYLSIAAINNEIKNNTVVVNGVSKTYAMTGWRIGYIACDPLLAKAVSNLQSHSTSNPCSISQAAAFEAIHGPQDDVSVMLKAFDERRKYIVKRLNSFRGINCIMPNGAFYVFPNISGLFGKKIKSKTINSSLDFADILLDEAKVAVIPGAGFGMDNHLRLSYATSKDNIEKGLDRIEAVLKDLVD